MSSQSLHEYAVEQGYEDYYDVLGIDENATQDEIDAQRQRLTAQTLNDQTAAKPSLAREASEELLDPSAREEYDAIGHEAYVQDRPGLTSFAPNKSPSNHADPPNDSNTDDTLGSAFKSKQTQTNTAAPPEQQAGSTSEPSSAQTQQKDGAGEEVEKKGILKAILPQWKTITAAQTWLLAFVGNRIIRTLRWGSKTIRGNKDQKSGISGHYYPTDSIVEGEEVIAKTNPTRWQSIGPYTLGLLFYAFAAFSTQIIQTGYLHRYINTRLGFITIQQSQIPFWWTLPVFCLLMGTTIIFAEILQRGSTWYILTDNRVFIREHPLSRRTASLKIRQLSKSEEESPFPINLINIGHVDLYTSASGTREERLWYLANSSDFKNELAKVEDKSSRQEQIKNTPPTDTEPSDGVAIGDH